jgi:hypothetical protein
MGSRRKRRLASASGVRSQIWTIRITDARLFRQLRAAAAAGCIPSRAALATATATTVAVAREDADAVEEGAVEE